jgi:hypothetical protein
MTPPVLVDDTEHVELRELDAILDRIHDDDAAWLDEMREQQLADLESFRVEREQAAVAMRERQATWQEFLDRLARV